MLVFLEWPIACPGETFDLERACLTAPSAIRFLDGPWIMSAMSAVASSGILAWAAAIWESRCSCEEDSWLEPWALPVPGLNLPPLVGGVKTGSAPLVEAVPWELLRERASECEFGSCCGG